MALHCSVQSVILARNLINKKLCFCHLEIEFLGTFLSRLYIFEWETIKLPSTNVVSIYPTPLGKLEIPHHITFKKIISNLLELFEINSI